jgi:hypothetical protein
MILVDRSFQGTIGTDYYLFAYCANIGPTLTGGSNARRGRYYDHHPLGYSPVGAKGWKEAVAKSSRKRRDGPDLPKELMSKDFGELQMVPWPK